MHIVLIVSFTLLIIYLLLFTVFAVLTGKPLKAVAINSLSGCALLFLLSALEKYLMTGLAVNIYSIAVSVIWGIPGVIIQLLIKILFF